MINLKNKKEKGFSVVETLVAIYLLSLAVLSVFSLSSRSISLARQSVAVQNTVFYAEDVFSMVEHLIGNNRLSGRSFDYGFFNNCSSSSGCSINSSSTGTITTTTCSGTCSPLYIDSTGFLSQGSIPPSALKDLKTTRSVYLTKTSADEIKAIVIIETDILGKKISKTYQRYFNNWYEADSVGDNVRIFVTSIVCPNETDLPNWGQTGTGAPAKIKENTASSWLSTHPQCSLASGWYYQWGHDNDFLGYDGVSETYPDHIGEADGTGPYPLGNTTGPGYNEWKTFGPTDVSGMTSVLVKDLEGAKSVALREVLQEGYVPFTYIANRDGTEDGAPSQPPVENVSGELYCNDDVLNFDNYDFIVSAKPDNNYYCVSFNAPN